MTWNMPPPYGYQPFPVYMPNPQNNKDMADEFVRAYLRERREEKRALRKKEEEDKKKKDEKKPEKTSVGKLFENFVFYLAISPFVGMMGLIFFSTGLRFAMTMLKSITQ